MADVLALDADVAAAFLLDNASDADAAADALDVEAFVSLVFAFVALVEALEACVPAVVAKLDADSAYEDDCCA